MSGEDDGTDRPHEATTRKLDEARRKGDIPRSSDLTAAAAMVGFLTLALLPGGWAPPRLGALGAGLLERADTLGPQLLAGGSALGGTVLAQVGVAMAPLAVIPGVMALAVLLALRGLIFAPSKLAPKLSRLSPLSNAKQKFGLTGLMEFAKSLVKLGIYIAVLWLFLAARMERILATATQNPRQVTLELLRLLVEFLTIIAVIMVAIAVLDRLWQVFDHARRQRMSHQELREDHKQSEGDPQVKQQRRQKAMAIATNRMLTEVPTATVIIVNPTHYAVALRWSPATPGAPVCVAKGADEIAARIRESALAAGVPIHADPPTARALFATTRLGHEIDPEHYRAVAAAIRFAEDMQRRMRGRR